MLAPLRTPTAFLSLTAALAGCFVAWTYVPTYSAGYTFDAQYRPAFYLAHLLRGDRPYWRVNASFGPRTSSDPCVILTTHGPEMGYIERTEGGWVCRETREPVLAAGYPISMGHYESFGVFAPVVARYSERIYLVPTEDAPLIDLESAVKGHNANVFCGNGIIQLPLSSTVELDPFAAVLDALFLLTLLSWLVSLAAIPKWPLWCRLTPAQRRRSHNA